MSKKPTIDDKIYKAERQSNKWGWVMTGCMLSMIGLAFAHDHLPFSPNILLALLAVLLVFATIAAAFQKLRETQELFLSLKKHNFNLFKWFRSFD